MQDRVGGEVSEVVYVKWVAERTKGKVKKMVVRPAEMHGFDTVALMKKQDGDLEVAELKM